MSKKTINLLIIALFLVVLGLNVYLVFNRSISIEEQKTSQFKMPRIKPPKPAATSSQPAVSTSTIDTSDWQTYRNEEYGYALQYPPTWMNEEERDYIGFRTSERLLYDTPALIAKIEIAPLNGRSLTTYVDKETLSCSMTFQFGEKEIEGLRRKELKRTKSGFEYFDVICINAEYGSDDRYAYFKHRDQVISLTFFALPETLTNIIIDSFSIDEP